MYRLVSTGSFCLLAVSLCGCTSFLTARAIESFTNGLAAQNVSDLEAATSADFRQRALRISDALDSLAVLPLPREGGEVKEVEEVSADERLVTVEVGKPPRTVQYRLKRESTGENPRDRKWVVDDVILTQARGSGQPPLTKSVTEQMDLLITVQEFIKFWSEGSREETLARVHPDLRENLEALSPVHLAQLTDHMLEGVKTSSFRPEARMQSSRATVQLPRQSGHLSLSLVRVQEPRPQWVIEDAVIESSRKAEPQAVSHLARVLRQATDFLRAFEEEDRDALQSIASASFYDQALRAADLSTVSVPVTQLLATRYELQEQDHHVDLLFDIGEDTYLLSMTQEHSTEPVLKGQEQTEPVCHVDELTIYERGGQQIKPLSVLFTAQAVVEVFAESLAARDRAMLAQLSTRDLNERVWERLESDELMAGLPLEGIPSAPPRVVTTIFQGPVTEITVTQGTRALTYVLHATGGRSLVDDVKFPINNRSGSLKTTLGVLAPIYNFAWAWKQGDVPTLTANSSDGLRRIVWIRTPTEVPAIGVKLDQFVPATLPRIEEAGSDLLVTLGTAEHGLRARLVTQRGRLVVEDLHLMGKSLPDGKLELVLAMRDWVNTKASQPTPRAIATRNRDGLTTPLAVLPESRSPGATGRVPTPGKFSRSQTSTAALPKGSLEASPSQTSGDATGQTLSPGKPTPALPASAVGDPASTTPLLQQPIHIPGA